MISKIISQKLPFLTRNTAKLNKNGIKAFFVRKNAIFLAKNKQKSSKFLTITFAQSGHSQESENGQKCALVRSASMAEKSVGGIPRNTVRNDNFPPNTV
jgi:hypothetical protein